MWPTRLPVGLAFALVLILTERGLPAEVHVPPLGFITIDTIPQTWAQLNPAYRLKGKVVDTLRFDDIQDIYVIRCFMHVLDDTHIRRTVEDAVAADAEFLNNPIPEGVVRTKQPALLTVLFKTRSGMLGLMSIFPELTIVEMNSRYGAVLNSRH
jgi:hypothetical protein